MKRILLFTSILFLFYTSCLAQQEAMFTHYMYNTLSVNPAYAGSRDALTITTLHRSQWVDFPGAPLTQTITLHSPVFTDAVNLGLSVVNDRIGPLNNTAYFLDYAFRFKLSDNKKLALGLKGGVNTYNLNLQALKATDDNDELNNNINNSLLGNIGFGIYYSTPSFYSGVSIPNLLENIYDYEAVTENILVQQRHYYLILGGLINLNNNIQLKPTSLVKITQAAPIEADVSFEFLFDEKFSLGVMARTGDAIGALLGLAVSEQFNVGYSFDWSFVNNTAKYNYGTHEVFLRYDMIFYHKKRIRSPRYFCTF